MKKFLLCLWAMACLACVFTACSDDESPKSLTTGQITGTYVGTLKVMGTNVPDVPVYVSKVDDSHVMLELKQFSFGGLDIGDISVSCTATPNQNELNLVGTTEVTVLALGNVSLPVSVTGDADGTELDIDILITSIPSLGALNVEFEGHK